MFYLEPAGVLSNRTIAGEIQTNMRYSADIAAGSLKVSESRVVAGLLLAGIDSEGWKEAILRENVLQARNAATGVRLARLIRQRLELMDAPLWLMVRNGDAVTATHALLAAAVKHSALLGDFLDIVVRERFRLFEAKLSKGVWTEYLEGCRGRDPEMPQWSESTRRRLGSTVFQSLAQTGFLENTKSMVLRPVIIAPDVIRYLCDRNEEYVLRCIQVSP